jgi:hypothetical protein
MDTAQMTAKNLSQACIKVTEAEGYEVGYSGKADNRNPYIPGELHNIWQEHYLKGVAQREQEDADAELNAPWKQVRAA